VSLPRIRLERCERTGDTLWLLDGASVRHLLKSLRLYEGASVEGLSEADGTRILTRLERSGRSYYVRAVKEEKPLPDKLSITLLIGMLKTEQFNVVLHTASELGVKNIVPVLCERSVPRFDAVELRKKMARWRKLLDEGTAVSREVTPPVLAEPVKFRDADWDSLPTARYAAVLASGAAPISSCAVREGGVVFAVGPEGDWTEAELGGLFEKNFVPVSMGHRIMRASTAALAGVAWFRLGSLADSNSAPPPSESNATPPFDADRNDIR
jgi:16S rRNA (uracil1498-N3)-methyltransferase